MGNEIEAIYPDKSVVLLHRCSLWGFAEAGHCRIQELAGVRSDFYTSVRKANGNYQRKAYEKNVWVEVEWRDCRFEVIKLGMEVVERDVSYQWIISDDEASVHQFLEAIKRWDDEVIGEVLVFANGCWQKNERLYDSIRRANFDDLILSPGLKETIRTDIQQFFSAQEEYAKYNIPWKRGLLLTGPPGNGKTMIVQSIIKETQATCLYVRDLRSDYREHNNIGQVFSRAREQAPCVLVLEDIDSLLNDGNRSQFLNEVDGFGQNTGILILATTNHPERLDPALINRPSRFDRKYELPLPGKDERERYLVHFSGRLDENLHLSQGEASMLANQTEGFSFAFLRELILSSMMAWIANPNRPFIHAVESTVPVLKEQILIGSHAGPAPEIED